MTAEFWLAVCFAVMGMVGGGAIGFVAGRMFPR